MDEDQNNQHHHDGHINLDPHTSPHDLTPEQMQQIQQILRALPPVSADLFEPIELADVGGIQPHIQSEFRGESDQNPVPGQEAARRSTSPTPRWVVCPCAAPSSTRACRLLIPASDTFTAYPSTSYTLYTVPTVPLGQAQTDTDYRNGIHINLALGQSFGIGPTLPASGPVSAPVPVPVSGPELRLPAWQYDPTPVSQNLLNEDYILPPTWSRTTGTDASATTAAAGPKLLYPVVPSSSASSFAPLIPGSVYPQNTPPTQHPSAISFHPRQHLHGGTISPELVRSSRPFVEHTNQQQYHPLQHHLPVQYHPSLSLPLPPIAAAQGTSSVPLDSGVSHPLPQTQPWLDVELIFPSLSTSVPYLPPVQHGITSTPSHLIAGGEPYADITAEMESGNWRDWNGGDGGDGGDGGEGGDGGDGLSDVSESKDEDEDEDGRYTPGECGGVAVGDELESEDGSEAYHDGDGGYDTEHEHEREHEHDHKYKHNEAADDHTDTDDDDGSESSFSATSHLSDPLLVPSSAFPSPPRTPTQAAGVTPHSNATPRHLTMRDQDSHATPSSSDPHIGTPALRQAIGVGTLHVTLSTDSDGGASPPQHGGGAVTIKPCVEPMMYTTAEYPIPEEMWEGEEEVEMKVEVEVDVDVAGEGNVANGEEALREPTGELARGRNENGVDQSSNVIGAKQAKGTTRSKPRARSIQHVQVSEQGDPEVDQSLQAQVNKESESFDHPRSRPKFDEACGDSSGSEPDTGSDANPSLKDPTYQPRPSLNPLLELKLHINLSKSLPNPNPSFKSGRSSKSKSNPKSIKKASARISNKVLVTGSGTGSTVPWSQSRTKAAGPRRNHKKLSDEARTNVESLRERLEATAFRSHINFDEKVFRALVDERFTEYIHWAELDTGEWGVVIPRENEFDTIVAPYLRNKAHAQRGAVRRQWSTYGFRTGQATTIQGVCVHHISHPLLNREDEPLWELVRSLPQLRGPSDPPTTKQPTKAARLTARNEQPQRQLRLALETNEALLIANTALEQRIRDICEQFPDVRSYLAGLPQDHELSQASVYPGPVTGPGHIPISQVTAPYALADLNAAAASSAANTNAPVPASLETREGFSIPIVPEMKSRNSAKSKGKARCPNPAEEPERTLRHKRSKLSE